VNQEFLQLGLQDLLDHMEKGEKRACQVLLGNLVFQGMKVGMSESSV
jgi:hypothetical protein